MYSLAFGSVAQHAHSALGDIRYFLLAVCSVVHAPGVTTKGTSLVKLVPTATVLVTKTFSRAAAMAAIPGSASASASGANAGRNRSLIDAMLDDDSIQPPPQVPRADA